MIIEIGYLQNCIKAYLAAHGLKSTKRLTNNYASIYLAGVAGDDLISAQWTERSGIDPVSFKTLIPLYYETKVDKSFTYELTPTRFEMVMALNGKFTLQTTHAQYAWLTNNTVEIQLNIRDADDLPAYPEPTDQVSLVPDRIDHMINKLVKYANSLPKDHHNGVFWIQRNDFARNCLLFVFDKDILIVYSTDGNYAKQPEQIIEAKCLIPKDLLDAAYAIEKPQHISLGLIRVGKELYIKGAGLKRRTTSVMPDIWDLKVISAPAICNMTCPSEDVLKIQGIVKSWPGRKIKGRRLFFTFNSQGLTIEDPDDDYHVAIPLYGYQYLTEPYIMTFDHNNLLKLLDLCKGGCTFQFNLPDNPSILRIRSNRTRAMDSVFMFIMGHKE